MTIRTRRNYFHDAILNLRDISDVMRISNKRVSMPQLLRSETEKLQNYGSSQLPQNSQNFGIELNLSPMNTALSATDDKIRLLDIADFIHEKEIGNACFHLGNRIQLQSALNITQKQLVS